MIKLKPFTSKTFVWLLRIFLLHLLGWYLFCLFPTGTGSVAHDISFPAGSGIKKLARELKQKGLIRSSIHFTLLSRLRGSANRLKAGDYRLDNSMHAGEILNKIANGEVDYRRFSLPEGYSIYQAAEILEQKGYFKRDEFLDACRKRELLGKFHIEAASCEGYLFPATYNLSRSETAEGLIEQMIGEFEKNYKKLAAGSIGVSMQLHDLVTVASLIEKEAVEASEKPLIASVFHNRLKIGMPLQSDPTAVYGVRVFAGKVTKKDILRPSAYNTYVIKGLPPGPIGNPGIEALMAAANPQKTPYLYFVARQDGTHQFSKNLEEHNRAVSRYLK